MELPVETDEVLLGLVLKNFIQNPVGPEGINKNYMGMNKVE